MTAKGLEADRVAVRRARLVVGPEEQPVSPLDDELARRREVVLVQYVAETQEVAETGVDGEIRVSGEWLRP